MSPLLTLLRTTFSKYKTNPILIEAIHRTKIITKFLCTLHITDTYLCTLTQVSGPSMFPTLNIAGDIVLVEKVSTRLGYVSHGDVVLVVSPLDPLRVILKRVVGMEGDVVSFIVGDRERERMGSVVVPKGHVWIQGDNICSSRDSRNFGAVPYALLRGKVFCRVWPPAGFGPLGGVWQ